MASGIQRIASLLAVSAAVAVCVSPAIASVRMKPAVQASGKPKPKPQTKPVSTLTKPLPVIAGSDYLALGDSVTFGFQEGAEQNAVHPSQFVGYPQLLGEDLHLTVANASCPGETSSSMINTSAPNDGCEPYRAKYPLHVNYTGSQLAYGESYLKTHPNVRLVTVQAGVVDLSLCQSTSSDGCASSAELSTLDTTLSANMKTILTGLRTKAHYLGQLAVVNYYAADYSPSLENTLIRNVDQVEFGAAKGYHVIFVNAYNAFQKASAAAGSDPCGAGLIDAIGTGVCGYHPTVAGQALISDTIRSAIKVGSPT